MRALFASVVVVSALSMVPAAFAAPLTMSGTVKSYDSSAKMLKLTNGDSFVIPASFKDPGIKVGEKIKVTYTKMGNKLEADTVTITK